MAAVQQYCHMGAFDRDQGDELGQFLVGQVPGSLGTAVVEDECLVEMVGLDPPEQLGGLLLRAMAAVAEQGDILRPGLTEVVLEGLDDRLTRRFRVFQDLYLQGVLEPTPAGIDPRLQVLPHLSDVVNAAPQLRDRRRIVVDTDEQCEDSLHDMGSRSIMRWIVFGMPTPRRLRRRASGLWTRLEPDDGQPSGPDALGRTSPAVRTVGGSGPGSPKQTKAPQSRGAGIRFFMAR